MSCNLGKSHKLLFEPKLHHARFSLVHLHFDVWTSNILSIFGFKNFALFVDDFSRYTWVFPIKNKLEVSFHFHNLRLCIEKLCNAHIHCLQIDKGSEYMSNCFRSYLSSHGIFHHVFFVFT